MTVDWKLRNTVSLKDEDATNRIGNYEDPEVTVDFWPDGAIMLWSGDRPWMGNHIGLTAKQLDQLVKLKHERDRWVQPKLLEPPKP